MQLLCAVFNVRKRTKQALCVGMAGILKNILQISMLYNSSCIHNADFIANLSHNSQVMGNHQHGGIVLLLQFLHQIQHLRLNGYIQSRRRLISNQKIRIAYKCHSNYYTLLHAAGKLMRILCRTLSRNANHFQHGLCLIQSLLFINLLIVKLNFLCDLIAYGHNRIQRGHWILENHRNMISTDGFHLMLTIFKNVLSLQLNGSSGDFSRRIGNQAQNRKSRCGLSCTSLSHQTQSFSSLNL